MLLDSSMYSFLCLKCRQAEVRFLFKNSRMGHSRCLGFPMRPRDGESWSRCRVVISLNDLCHGVSVISLVPVFKFCACCRDLAAAFISVLWKKPTLAIGIVQALQRPFQQISTFNLPCPHPSRAICCIKEAVLSVKLTSHNLMVKWENCCCSPCLRGGKQGCCRPCLLDKICFWIS